MNVNLSKIKSVIDRIRKVDEINSVNLVSTDESLVDFTLSDGILFKGKLQSKDDIYNKTDDLISFVLGSVFPNALGTARYSIALIDEMIKSEPFKIVAQELSIPMDKFAEMAYSLWFQVFEGHPEGEFVKGKKGGQVDSFYNRSGFMHHFTGEMSHNSFGGLHHWYGLYRREKRRDIEIKSIEPIKGSYHVYKVRFNHFCGKEKVSTVNFNQSPEASIAMYTYVLFCNFNPFEEPKRKMWEIQTSNDESKRMFIKIAHGHIITAYSKDL